MRRAVRMGLSFLVAGLSLCVLGGVTARADEPAVAQLVTIMRAELEVVEGAEVIVSLVEIPPATALDAHYHPGEEFIYVLEGSGTIHQKDEADVQLRAGSVFKVPLEQVHSAESGEEGIKVLVFRVHRKGQPERIMTE